MKRGLVLLLAAACSRGAEQPSTPVNELQAPRHEPALNPSAPGEPGGLPDDRTPVPEGKIDPKSAQGAGQVLQRYFALLEAGKTDEADLLWSGPGTPLDFAQQLAAYSEVHANIGAPGELGGAAGSIYVDVPVQLYGRLASGAQFNTRGTMTLRRVNDVPGSTSEEREWHIYRSDFPAQR